VTVDCGSVSVDEVSFAKSIGLEIMITDHHEPGETLPDCILINPKRRISAGAEGADSAENTAGAGNGSESAENSAESRGYPFAGLCGCAVAFKLACAMFDRAAIKTKGSREVLHQLVDLAAIATIADIMPLCDENRTFVKYGLDLIRKRKRKALAVLLESMGTEPADVSAKEVSFGVAPRINAVGRLGNASEAVEFFITKDEVRMREIAARMNASNKERRQLQDACYRSCMEICEEDTDGEGRPAHRFLLLRPAVFHEGISGIVAGQIREKTGLPCAVFADSGDCLKASARSVGHLDMIALLRRHEQLLLRVGGHAMAAGFMIRKEDETPLREALNRDLDGLLAADPRLLEEREPADAALDPADVDIALAEALGVMAPFGAGNPKPRVELNIRAGDISRLYYLGEGAHARFSVSGIPCIFFRGAEALSRAMEAGGKIRVIGCPEINTWNGKRGLQFVVNCCIGAAD
jgi:single-stranded-DNA-specific exonuclease